MRYIVKAEFKKTEGYCYGCGNQTDNKCDSQSIQSCTGFKCPEQRY